MNDEQSKLIDAVVDLLQAEGHAVQQFETHLSRILVAGGLAYKFKKARHLDFVDFSTLEARRFYCSEELRLNRRFAPQLYIDVVPISMENGKACIDGAGLALDYVIRMRAFEQGALWSQRVKEPGLSADEIDQLAMLLARIHLDAEPAPDASDWGSMNIIASTAHEILNGVLALCGQMRNFPLPASERRKQAGETLSMIAQWTEARADSMRSIAEKRKATRHVREGHGDLHLGNILTIGQHVEMFDCIEFAPSLRYIDVMNDLAFVIMDLSFNEQAALATRLLNSYLERTGDYEGLATLPYYSVLRALVRGKVALLHAVELGDNTKQTVDAINEGMEYIAFAGALTQKKKRAAVVIMHGYSGSGKTWFAQIAAQTLGAVHLRSDVERKRLSGLGATERGRASLYTPAMTEETYHRLQHLAKTIVEAGWPVIVDAAFLQAWQRELLREFAARSGSHFLVIEVTASASTLRRRIEARMLNNKDASDANAAVLESQINTAEPLTEIEIAQRIRIDMDGELTDKAAVALCEPIRKAISGSSWFDKLT